MLLVNGFDPGGGELLATGPALIPRNGLVVVLGCAIALLAVEVGRRRLGLLCPWDGLGVAKVDADRNLGQVGRGLRMSSKVTQKLPVIPVGIPFLRNSVNTTLSRVPG